MNKQQTLLGALDPDVAGRIASRRGALRTAGRFGAGALAALSVPGALGLMARDAFGRTLPSQVDSVLRFALTLEYLEFEYYDTGVNTAGLIPEPALTVYQGVTNHERAHVRLLEAALGLAEDEAKPQFDFTAGGTFDPFDNYQTFLALSQGFEDTGVRAYKGQAPALIDEPDVLRTALQIHSVEARHASIVRRLRGQPGWVEFDQTNVPALAATYAGEDNTTHLGVDITTLTVKSVEAVTEAYDEPLTMAEVLAIAGPFIVDTED
jgi:hypothetical protein